MPSDPVATKRAVSNVPASAEANGHRLELRIRSISADAQAIHEAEAASEGGSETHIGNGKHDPRHRPVRAKEPDVGRARLWVAQFRETREQVPELEA